jgi:predicted nucleotidyltransferase
MKPEQLVEKLRKVQPLSLRSVILYGSAVAGDFVKKRSDYNVLVIAESLGVPELRALSSVARRWVKAGNPPPLLFTLERLKQSADVFPIEILDMKAANRVLYGADVLSRIPVSEGNLRHQVESELKGKLIQLREAYLITGGKPRDVVEVLVRSIASFLVLFRAALRLYEIEVPARKLDALAALARRIPLDPAPFETVEALKEGRMKVRQVNADALFGNFLKTVETVVDAIDSYLQGRGRADEQELSS